MLSLIVAMGRNREIGKDNKLLWHLPNDLRRFQSLTMGHPMIMGRKTFESLPKLLPGREHWVLTRQTDWQPEGVRVFSSVEEVLQALGEQDAFVIGGEQIYRAFLPYVKRAYITKVHGFFPEADAHFPYLVGVWNIREQVTYTKDEKHAYNYTFQILERS
mgnify:CR=1 FL=1